MSAIGRLQEAARQKASGDTAFLKRLPPIFELQVPAKASGNGREASYLFALPMPPTEYDLDEPFTVSITLAQDGGVIAEESGVLLHQIRIMGTTGVKVRPFNGSAFGKIQVPRPNGTLTRDIFAKSQGDISGHRYFQYLQDGPFRLYSDLKKDQELAEDTRLILHIPKDDEHWAVIPQNFRLKRASPRDRFLYWFEITLTGIAVASAPIAAAPEDKGLMAQLFDTVQQVRNGIALVGEAINDLNRLRADIESNFRQLVGVLDELTGIVNAARGFAENTADSITMARNRITSSAQELDAALEDPLALSIPDQGVNLFRSGQDGLYALLAHPEAFERGTDPRIDEAFARGLGKSQSALATAAAGQGPTTFRALEALGSGLLPGDQARDEVLRRAPEEVKRYRSVIEVRVAPSDTIEGLSARFLGDARLWRFIVILNDLLPPYLSAAGLPGTITPGQTILIPSTASPPRSPTSAAVLGALPTTALVDRLLGADFRTVDLPGGLLDWAIDDDGGAVDLQVVSGVDNLGQGLRMRLETERGSDSLFQQVGLRAVIGVGLTATDLTALQFRAQEAVTADPRVAAVRDVRISTNNPPDAVVTDLDVTVRGLESSVPVRAHLPSTVGATL